VLSSVVGLFYGDLLRIAKERRERKARLITIAEFARIDQVRETRVPKTPDVSERYHYILILEKATRLSTSTKRSGQIEMICLYIAAFLHHLSLPHTGAAMSGQPTSIHLLRKHPQLHRHIWVSIMLDHVTLLDHTG
jgi:hypothetical protein